MSDTKWYRISTNPDSSCFGHGMVGYIFQGEHILFYADGGGEIANVRTRDPILTRGTGSSFASFSPHNVTEITDLRDILEVGMRVVYRNGESRIVGAERSLIRGNGIIGQSITNYDGQLLDNTASPLDIMSVYEAPKDCKNFFNTAAKGMLVWQRQPEVEKSKAEIELEVLQGQAEAIAKQIEIVARVVKEQ